MGRWMEFAFIGFATVTCSIPIEAASLLNCRLMDSDTPSRWRQGCKWETIISQCKPNELCKVKRQNIVSVSAKAALTANLELRTSVLVSGTTVEAASLAAAINSRGPRSTAVASTGSGVLGGSAGTLDGAASVATGTVDRALSDLAP
jgi:hypothetical protein